MKTDHHFPKFVCLILSLICFSTQSLLACAGGSNGGAFSPIPTSSYQTMSVTDGNYYTFVVPSTGCLSYVFTFCSNGGSAGFDTQITILDNTGTPVALGYNDDFCGLQSQVSWSPTSPGTYRVLINSYDCASNGNSGTLAYIENGGTPGDYSMVGDATSSSPFTCVDLTANTSNQTGCAWDANSTLDFSSTFTYDFTVNLGSNDGGADGIAFVIQNDPSGICACGSSGGGFAAQGITNSLIIEIDTYLNTEDRDDGANMTAQGVACSGGTEPDHLDLWLNGNVNPLGGACPGSPGARIIPTAEPLLNGASNYNVENGLDHILRVTWVLGTPGTFIASLLDIALTTTFATVSYSFDPATVFGTTTPFFGFTAATGGLSNAQSFCNPAVLLPVQMVSLNVDCVTSGQEITWVVASQINNDFFTVLRSTDGQNYSEIGKVDGAGNSQMEMTYHFIDPNPIAGLCYYTISQTDNDGKENLTGYVRVLECQNENIISIYPNPSKVNEPLFIELNSFESLLVTIYDVSGSIVYSEQIEGNSQNSINPELSSGIYQIIITNDTGQLLENKKLVVMN